MSSPVADAVTAVVLFSGTNVDDLLLISLFSAYARSGNGPLKNGTSGPGSTSGSVP